MKVDNFSQHALSMSGRLQPRQLLLAPKSKRMSVNPSAVILTVGFVALRLGTSDGTSVLLPMVGLVLLVLLMHANATWGFVLVLYDMCLLAEQVGVESWQIPDVARFRDLEFVMLMAMGIGMGGLRFRGVYFTRLTKPIKIYLILIFVVTIYSGITHDLRDALQASRILFFIALIFVMPAVCRDLADLRRLFKYIVILVAVSSLIDFAGFIVGDAVVMTPFNHNLDEAGRVWAGSGGVARVWGGIGYAGYSVPFNFLAIFVLTAIMVVRKVAPLLWVLVVAIAIALEVLSISKSGAIGLAIGLGVIVVMGWKQGTRQVAFGVLAMSLGILMLLLVSAPFIQDSIVYKEYTANVSSVFEQLRGNQEGSTTARLEYFMVAPDVMSRSGGNVLFGMGYQLLPTEYGVLFRIAPFHITAFQSTDQRIGTTSLDSGWAVIFWTLGLMGVCFFIWFIWYYLRVSLTLGRLTNDVVIRALSLALFAFCVVFPLMNIGMHMLYGKNVQSIVQFVLLVGALGLWLDYSMKLRPQRAVPRPGST